jgi:uncharacterized protein YukE
MGSPINVDDPAIQAVLNAFEDASETTKAVRSGVTAASDGLAWSGEASTAYKNSVTGWLEGLSKVEQAMGAMDEEMRKHQKATYDGEDKAKEAGGRWAPPLP